MRDMLDTLTRGPFRDDTHRAAVEAAAEDLALRPMREPQAAICDAPARAVRVEAGMGAGGLKNQTHYLGHIPPLGTDLLPTLKSDPATLNVLRNCVPTHGILESMPRDPWAEVSDLVSNTYASARWILASAGSLPLASSEPWAESDQAYRARLSDYLGYNVSYSGSMLDDYGVEAAELPRARLVSVVTMQGEN